MSCRSTDISSICKFSYSFAFDGPTQQCRLIFLMRFIPLLPPSERNASLPVLEPTCTSFLGISTMVSSLILHLYDPDLPHPPPLILKLEFVLVCCDQESAF